MSYATWYGGTAQLLRLLLLLLRLLLLVAAAAAVEIVVGEAMTHVNSVNGQVTALLAGQETRLQ